MERSFFLIFLLSSLTTCLFPTGTSPSNPRSPISTSPFRPLPPSTNPTSVIHHPSLNPPQSRVNDFPYDLQMDTLAHMNCPGDSQVADPVFVSFKMGSYMDGLRLSREFLDQTKNFSVAQKERTLQENPFYASAAQIGLSQRGDPTSVLRSSLGVATQSFFSFAHPHISNVLAQHGVTYALANQAKLELQIPIAGSAIYQYTPVLTGAYVITMTYNNGNDQQPLSKGRNLFYGKTYSLDFEGGNSGKSYLTHVEEESLLTNERTGRWDCPASMRFAIYRHPDLTLQIYKKNIKHFKDRDYEDAEDVCEKNRRGLSSRHRQIFSALFPSQTFFIGTSRKSKELCIQPIDHRHSCYAGTGAIRIEFDKECSAFDQFKRCPSYLSICVRK